MVGTEECLGKWLEAGSAGLCFSMLQQVEMIFVTALHSMSVPMCIRRSCT